MTVERTAPWLLASRDQLDLEATLDGGQAFGWYREDEAYRGVLGREVVVLRQTARGIAAESPLGTLSPETEVQLARYLDLTACAFGFDAFRARYLRDECLGQALREWPGLRLLRQDPWECLVAFLTSATSNIPRIKLNIGSLVRALGDRVGPGVQDFAFPAPDRIAEAGEQELRRLGFGFRAKYIASAARAIASGEFALGPLERVPYQDARNELTRLDGVGEKIADCVLAFSLHHHEAFPIDRWTRRALESWYGMPASLNPSDAACWARDRFGPAAAYVQQYLFHRQRLSARMRPVADQSALAEQDG